MFIVFEVLLWGLIGSALVIFFIYPLMAMMTLLFPNKIGSILDIATGSRGYGYND